MSVRARRRGREEAFKLLFQADQGVTPWDEMLELNRANSTASPEAWEFALELTQGAWERREEIDPILDRLARGWTVERMAAADRALLRLAAFELMGRPDVPTGVSINEAVELAKRYGTDDSPRFINGVLGALARELGEQVEPGDHE
ncbi:MAG: transcription antitermination factor NusB [Armatimonadetes bacterium]|nr:transcription antitermination factor NusB [Armatimonadota bacterium]